MRTYELAGLQLWTFTPSYRRDGKRGTRKCRAFLLWDYGDPSGYKQLKRREAASFLQSFRREVTKVLDQ